MEVVLTIIDTAGIQPYIFGSNRLRENIGASYLVEQATRDWVYEELNRLGTHNISNLKKGTIDRERKIEEHDLAAELVYAGGGNTVLLFRTSDEARVFTQLVSRRVLEDAPGLEIVIAHSKPFEWQPNQGWPLEKTMENLYERVEQLRDGHLAQKKRTRQATPTPLLGLGVTQECASTGLVASQNSLEPEPRLVSSEIVAKLKASTPATKRLRDLFDEAKFDEAKAYAFTNDLDHLGRKGGEESYIAVVHIDGNDMGSLIKERVRQATSNRDYIEQMRDFSEGVERASKAALINTFKNIRPTQVRQDGKVFWRLTETKPALKDGNLDPRAEPKEIRLYQEPEKQKDDGKPCWPFRPIVFGGDDLTFVCNGPLGLSLATIYMREFAAQTQSDKQLKTKIHTGAGVCIVKVHYPFRRAYYLSASLTGAAKGLLKDKRNESGLDWHIAATGLGGDLSAIQAREYTGRDGSLRMRPVWVAGGSDWRTWQNFNRLVALFNYHQDFAGRRNKLKSLREALRDGAEAVKSFLKTYKTKLPKLRGASSTLHEVGWDDMHCAYFDALEAMDHHFFVEEVPDDYAD
jgi:hypothetical protein